MRANFKLAEEKKARAYYLFPTETVSPQVKKKRQPKYNDFLFGHTLHALFLPAFSQDVLALLPLSEIPRADA